MQPVSAIRELNPSILNGVAPAGFIIHIPKGSAEPTEAAIQSVPADNRRAWRLHHVEAGDTLETIAKAYHLRAESIVAVNRATDSLERGDMLLIPAVFHEERQRSHARARTRGKARSAGAFRSGMADSTRRGTRVAIYHRVPAQVLHRKAAVRTAMLGR
jgi:membrane-bound lytic murein transglycosylase D